MAQPLKIDVVSDVVCPWCAIGVNSLKQAIGRLDGAFGAELRFHAFELDPERNPEGRNIREMLKANYGLTDEQVSANQEMVRARGEEVGFVFNFRDDNRIYNSFDAHRLLRWAGDAGGQEALKQALFRANFTDGRNVSDRDVLVSVAEEAGLDGAQAREVLTSGRYADEVRKEEAHWQAVGITSVPTFIVNDKYAISGGQPVDVFEQALREIAAE